MDTINVINSLTTGNQKFGLWHVKTYKGEEGEYSVDLGIHLGNFDEIALSLGNMYGHTLDISPAKIQTEHSIIYKSVYVYKTPNINSLVSDNITVSDGCYYKSSLLRVSEDAAKVITRNIALAKLTPEEREALGL